jgi:hypothetical protein
MPEAEIEVNGGIVVYEFVGPDDGEVVVLTPGGRFSKDHGGAHAGQGSLFDPWVDAAPVLLDFMAGKP